MARNVGRRAVGRVRSRRAIVSGSLRRVSLGARGTHYHRAPERACLRYSERTFGRHALCLGRVFTDVNAARRRNDLLREKLSVPGIGEFRAPLANSTLAADSVAYAHDEREPPTRTWDTYFYFFFPRLVLFPRTPSTWVPDRISKHSFWIKQKRSAFAGLDFELGTPWG